jgi:hypothetical protein
MDIVNLFHKSILTRDANRVRVMLINGMLVSIFAFLNAELCEGRLMTFSLEVIDYTFCRYAIHESKHIFYFAGAIRQQMCVIKHDDVSENYYAAGLPRFVERIADDLLDGVFPKDREPVMSDGR